MPHLYFYSKSGDAYSRFKFKGTHVEVAENSEYALAREEMILETSVWAFLKLTVHLSSAELCPVTLSKDVLINSSSRNRQPRLGRGDKVATSSCRSHL